MRDRTTRLVLLLSLVLTACRTRLIEPKDPGADLPLLDLIGTVLDGSAPPDSAITPDDIAPPPRDLGFPLVDLSSPVRDFSSPVRDFSSPPRDFSLPPRDFSLPPRDLSLPPRDFSLPPLPDLATPAPDFSLPPPIDLATPPLPDFSSPPIDLTPPPLPDLVSAAPGCADGTREGFLSFAQFPRIASCAGGFRLPGVLSSSVMPACARGAGNGSANPDGFGCNVEDLCEAGWHVCRGAADVAAHSPTGCAGAASQPNQFFISRQSSTGCGVCAVGMNLANPPCDSQSCAAGCAQTDAISNDVFGCGSAGAAPAAPCSPLDRFSHNLCAMLPAGWSCGSDGFREAHNVIHTLPTGGGALCCID